MADQMCGPSNALQNFQKHSTVDRTLQQDRLLSRQSPSQGFRSSPGPNAGLSEHEFNSFQAGQLPLDHGFQPNTFQHAPPTIQQSGPVDWASDFQRMNISSPGHQSQHQNMGMQASSRMDTAGWHQDFARQQTNQSIPTASNTQSLYTNNGFQYQPQFGGLSSQYYRDANVPELSITQQKQPEQAFDEAAFAAAFDAASAAELQNIQDSTQEQESHLEVGQNILIEESADALHPSDDLEFKAVELRSQEPIGADTIEDHLIETPEQAREEQEALARTAAKLLDSVRHEQSSKFQESKFLSLMRQFRDREKTVEGDSVVGVGVGVGNERDYQLINELSQAFRLLGECDGLYFGDGYLENTFSILLNHAGPGVTSQRFGGEGRVGECCAMLCSILDKQNSSLCLNVLSAFALRQIDRCNSNEYVKDPPSGMNLHQVSNARGATNARLHALNVSESDDRSMFEEMYVSEVLSGASERRYHDVLSIRNADIEAAAEFVHAREICRAFGVWEEELSAYDLRRFLDLFKGPMSPDVRRVDYEAGSLKKAIRDLREEKYADHTGLDGSGMEREVIGLTGFDEDEVDGARQGEVIDLTGFDEDDVDDTRKHTFIHLDTPPGVQETNAFDLTREAGERFSAMLSREEPIDHASTQQVAAALSRLQGLEQSRRDRQELETANQKYADEIVAIQRLIMEEEVLSPSQNEMWAAHQGRMRETESSQDRVRPMSTDVRGDRPYRCTHEGCSKAFNLQGNLEVHERRRHGNE